MIKRIKRDLDLVDRQMVVVLGFAAAVSVGVIVWGLVVWSLVDYERSGESNKDLWDIQLDTTRIHNDILADHEARIKELERRNK